MKDSLVSVVIPCYNASEFISDTLKSILSQQKAAFEIIVVNDGSTDDSEQKIHSFSDSRLRYLKQANKGVSSARNLGLLKSTGEYIIFFDADDLMSDNFIHSRSSELISSDLDFISGPVKKFGSTENNFEMYRGTSDNLASEILLYDRSVITCPSNYIFKTAFLRKHHLQFDLELTSTADRYFLLRSGLYGKSNCIDNCSPLLYRFSENSMSNRLTKKLVLDNEKYYELMQKNGLLPQIIRNKSLFLGYYILSGANYKIKNWPHALKYGLKALAIDPLAFIKKVLAS